MRWGRLARISAITCAVASLATTLTCAPDPARFATTASDDGRAAAAEVDQATLERHVNGVYEARLREEPVVSAFSLQLPHVRTKTRDYIDSALRAQGTPPFIEHSNDDGIEVDNVVLDLPGSEPSAPRVLLVAHYDSWYQAGADDNASALAALLETSRILSSRPHRAPIRIVFSDREEELLLGATRYEALHRGEPLRIALVLDCVGYASSVAGSQTSPTGLTLRDTGDFLAVIANDTSADDLERVGSLAGEMSNGPRMVGGDVGGDGLYPGTADLLRSDHAVFWSKGGAALFFTDTADFRNANYHTPNDLPATLDYDFLTRVARLVVASALAFAQ